MKEGYKVVYFYSIQMLSQTEKLEGCVFQQTNYIDIKTNNTVIEITETQH